MELERFWQSSFLWWTLFLKKTTKMKTKEIIRSGLFKWSGGDAIFLTCPNRCCLVPNVRGIWGCSSGFWDWWESSCAELSNSWGQGNKCSTRGMERATSSDLAYWGLEKLWKYEILATTAAEIPAAFFFYIFPNFAQTRRLAGYRNAKK